MKSYAGLNYNDSEVKIKSLTITISEYQIERLHLLGKQNPGSNLDKKVVGYSFAEKLSIIDPVTGTIEKKPFKPFMVSQLQIAFERYNLVLSEFDEVLYKQLIDYEVVRLGRDGQPVFTSENEHSIDALGLSYLAFVLKFPDLTKTVEKIEYSSHVTQTNKVLGFGRAVTQLWQTTSAPFSTHTNKITDTSGDRRGDRPTWVKINTSKRTSSSNRLSRNINGFVGRSMW